MGSCTTVKKGKTTYQDGAHKAIKKSKLLTELLTMEARMRQKIKQVISRWQQPVK